MLVRSFGMAMGFLRMLLSALVITLAMMFRSGVMGFRSLFM